MNMKKPKVRTSVLVRCLILACALAHVTPAQADSWLEGNPNAIWERAPGVYKEGSNWYVIFHAAAGDTNVRIQGDFTNGSNNSIALERTPDGKFWWFKGTDSSFSRAPVTGDGYRFSLVRGNETLTFPDPASRWQSSKDIETAMSKIFIGSDQNWSDQNWQRSPKEELNIYQIHAWRFTGRNNGSAFEQVTEELDNDGQNDYINKLGSTAVQFLPISDFTSALGWGYNPNYFYAIEQTFGGPVHFKNLVNTAHQNDLDVVMDLVFNHISHNSSAATLDANTILSAIDRDTYVDGETEWGAMYNFDNDVAKHFLIQNVLYLAKEFRITGFRFDLTNLIWNENSQHIITKGSGGGWDFLRELYGTVKAYDPNIWFTYEEFPDWYGISSDNVDGTSVVGTTHGPTDSQWVDVFHDHFKEVLTGGNLDLLRDVFSHLGEKWSDGTVYSASHDEVGNTDDRIALKGRDGRGWEMNQISGAGTILARGTPMIFMGQEAGEEKQFDIDLWTEDDRLNLTDYESHSERQKILRWFTKMNEIRSSDSSTFASSDSTVMHINDGNGITAFSRDNGKYIVVLNFRGTAYQNYDIGISGTYRELANTSWAEYNVRNHPLTSRGAAEQSFTDVAVPPYGAVVLMGTPGDAGDGGGDDGGGTGLASTFPALTFRSSANNWEPVSMTLVSDNTWQLELGLNASDLFKFDVFGDWETNYGDSDNNGVLEQSGSDITSGVTGQYRVELNDQDLTYQLINLDGGNGSGDVFESNLSSIHFRGTPNSWGSTPLELIDNNTWSVTIDFDGQASQRFKFDVFGDWSTNYGDDGADGTLDAAGADIVTPIQGTYRIELNDQSWKYDVIAINPINIAPVAYAGNDINVAVGDEVVFDGTGSYDSDGSISDYQWSGGLANSATPIKTFDTEGQYTFDLTVVDNSGASSNTDSVTVNVTGGVTSVLPSLNFRGTANDWGVSPMALVATNTWQITVFLDGRADQRFKLDVAGDWQNNYGDDNADGVLNSWGADITTGMVGNFIVEVNDLTLQYQLIPIQ
jgi:1,4-alpha-glucan branching enzyme